MTDSLSTTLDHAATSPRERNVLDLLARSRPEIAKLLPPGVTDERFERVVRTTLRTTPLLAECDPWSFLGAVMHTAQLGLEPGPLGLVYFVPFKREVTLIVGYRGYIELAYRSGQVKDVSAELVYEGDVFRVAKGTSPKIVHEDAGPPGDRAIVNAYAVARLKTGGTVQRVLYPDEWEAARKASPAGRKNDGPWRDHFGAMVRKTAVRRLEPMLPKTPAFSLAVMVDDHEAVRLDDQIADAAGDVLAPTPETAADTEGGA